MVTDIIQGIGEDYEKSIDAWQVSGATSLRMNIFPGFDVSAQKTHPPAASTKADKKSQIANCDTTRAERDADVRSAWFESWLVKT